jgi:Xaa-Pro aminopeptidase
MTEIELQQELERGLTSNGIQFDGAYCLFGPSGLKLEQGPFGPSENPLKPGLFVRTDIQGIYDGYYSDVSRVVGFGQVSREMEHAHALVRRVLERLLAEIGPGMSCGEIRRLELELYKGSGYCAVVPFTGHGVGRMIHEPPYLFERDSTRLAAGMVLAIEPTVCYSSDGDIFICLEDQVLVTENGCEQLTSGATLDLYPN